jgi:hypothetical protein
MGCKQESNQPLLAVQTYQYGAETFLLMRRTPYAPMPANAGKIYFECHAILRLLVGGFIIQC